MVRGLGYKAVRYWVLLAVAGVALGGLWWLVRTRVLLQPSAKNLILISIDTLRADHLGCYGYPRPTSPALDALAAQGVLFTDVAATSPWTLPSHATLFTGLYPQHHGVKSDYNRLSNDTPTLASALAARGYRTMAIINCEYLSQRYGLDRGFEAFDYISEFSPGDAASRRLVDRGEAITNQAMDWLSRRDARPFFLFLHYYDPHSDYDPAPQYRQMFTGDYQGPIDGTTKQLLAIRAAGITLAPRDRDQLVALYDAEIRQLDDQLARLFRFLDERGNTSDTIVAVTADHGEEFMDHGGVLHGRTLYQELIAVPLLIRGPGLPRAVRVDQTASLADVAPTLLELLGVPVTQGVDGISLRPFWSGGERLPNREVFAEADHNNAEPDIKRMIRRGRDKLYFDRLTEEKELYDLRADPGERTDLSGQEPGRVRTLFGRLEVFMRSARTPKAVLTPSQDVLERLRQLGYAP